MPRFLIAAAVCAAAFASPATALAQDEDPIPTGCDAPVIADDLGDASVDDAGGQLPKAVNKHAGPDDMDLESANITWVPGGDHAVADIQVADLDGKALQPPDSDAGSYYYLFFITPDNVTHFVKAVIGTAGGDPTYSYGSISVLAIGPAYSFSVYSTDGATTGKLVQGKDGHVLIDVPKAILGAPGAMLTDLTANADSIIGKDDYYGFNNHIDTAPDGTDTFHPSGVAMTLTDCSLVPAP